VVHELVPAGACSRHRRRGPQRPPPGRPSRRDGRARRPRRLGDDGGPVGRQRGPHVRRHRLVLRSRDRASGDAGTRRCRRIRTNYSQDQPADYPSSPQPTRVRL